VAILTCAQSGDAPLNWKTFPVVLLSFLFFVMPFRLNGQSHTVENPDSPRFIAGIAVLGNRLTKAEIILREMTLHKGDTVNVEEIEYSKTRIYSLGLFNRVDISYPQMDSTILVIEVEERWYYYPVPLVGIVDRDFSKWYYGLGFKHENVRGWNEKLFAGFVLGYDPWASVSYSNPWIFDEAQFFSETGFQFSKTRNKSLIARGNGNEFNEIHFGLGETLGKRLDQFRSIWISGAFNYVEVTDNAEGRTISGAGIDRYISFGIGAKHDTRNLKEYATQGMFGAIGMTKKGFGFGDVDCIQTTLDVRVYQTLWDGPTLAVRAFTGISSGPSVPNYSHFYFGFSERLRGHFQEEVEGENIAGASIELRIPLFPVFYLSMPEIPIPQFATWKLGLYAAIFSDAGKTWNKSASPHFESASSGYGVGIHFLLPYGFVFRIDRAWNENQRGEWIFDIGAAF